jgi:DNA-binding MarR family transcriptional regulator
MKSELAASRVRRLPTWLLMQSALTAQQLVAARLATAGAHRYHYSMLSALEEFGPMSQAELGLRCGLDRSDTSAGVVDLAERRLVERAADPADRRRNVVRITADGRTHLERLDGVIAEAQIELLRSLSQDERQALIALLTRVVDTPSSS